MKTYIIDGYNLLWKLLPEQMNPAGLQKSRQALERRLQEFISLEGEAQALLVFDGEGQGTRLTKAQLGLRICFSPGGIPADEKVLDLAQEYSGRGEVYVITSDLKDIGRRLGGTRAVHITSESFKDRLERALNVTGDRDQLVSEEDEKPSAPKGDEIDTWLEEFDMKE